MDIDSFDTHDWHRESLGHAGVHLPAPVTEAAWAYRR
jgi:hypothetical protein